MSNPKYRTFVIAIERFRSFGNGDGENYWDVIGTRSFLPEYTEESLEKIRDGFTVMSIKCSIGEVDP